MTTPENESLEESDSSTRPDPFFKLITRLKAEQLGLRAEETELQHSSLADLILTVPPDTKLEGTLFDFFRTENVIEFKSQGDKFNLRAFGHTALRTWLVFLKGKNKDLSSILNVTVCSRRPREFFAQARQEGVYFRREKEHPWLWRAKVGFQNVAIVTCLDLPLEESYYSWLVFAPANSRKWRDFVLQLIQERNFALLERMESLRPKEYAMVTKSFEELLNMAKAEGLLTPEDEEQIDEELAEGTSIKLKGLARRHPDKLDKALAGLKPEERLAGLKPEERQAMLEYLLKEQNQKD